MAKTNEGCTSLVCGPVAHEVHMRLSGPPKANDYVRINSTFHSLGGSGAFAALALAARGIKVTLLSPKPVDEYALKIETILANRGIRWTGICETGTLPVFYSIYEPSGTRWIIHERVLIQSQWLPKHIDSDFVMLYPTAPETAIKIAEMARNNRTPLVFCPNASLLPSLSTFTAIAKESSWVIVNAEEARGYTSCASTKDALAAMTDMCPNIVITQGSNEVILFTGGVKYSVDITPVERSINAGDGDIAAAVFSAGMFAQGLCAVESLERTQAVVGRFLTRGELSLESPAVFDLLKL